MIGDNVPDNTRQDLEMMLVRDICILNKVLLGVTFILGVSYDKNAFSPFEAKS